MKVTDAFNRLAMHPGTTVARKLNDVNARELIKAAEVDNDNGCCSAPTTKGDNELKRLVEQNPDKFELNAKCMIASHLIGLGIRLNCDQNSDQIAKK